MRILVVGAGATGGYLGARLIRGGRDVTFLAHPRTRDRLRQNGVAIRSADGSTVSTPVRAITGESLSETYDVVILAVRSEAIHSAIEDLAPAVGPASTVVPVVNGVAHIDALVARFGADRVCGGVAQLVTSLQDGVIQELRAGVVLQVGAIGADPSIGLTELAGLLTVDGVTTTVSDDIMAAMWSKFAFITATAALTCLLKSAIGPVAGLPGGRATVEQVLVEVDAVLAAAGHGLGPESQAALHAFVTDPASTFGPSMYRDLTSGRSVESTVLDEFLGLAHRHQVVTPVLTAAAVAIDLHNAQVRG